MESARSYSSTRMEAYSGKKWDANGNVMSFQAGIFSQTKEEEFSAFGKRQENSMKKTSDLIQDKYKEMRALSSKSRKTDKDAVDYIRSQCLDFLFMVLWGKKSTDEGLNTYDTGTAGVGGEGGSYSEYHYYEETEETSFSTTGTVKTEDGKEFSFNLNLMMTRSFVEESGIEINYGAALCDPLVINLKGSVANVSDQTFKFDIDADGETDTISELGYGSGYLALDQNDDGVINDGSELFGTKSGDGFADLAAYDQDKNGWIDENDEIFSKLLIWTKDVSGNDVLCSLKDQNVGAIYLGNESTRFSLNEMKTNQTNAVIRRTGIFMYENGSVGTIQHVDMAKEYSY